MTTEEGIREKETTKKGIHPHQESQDLTAQTEKKHDTNEIFATKAFPQCQVSFLNCYPESLQLKYSILCRMFNKEPRVCKTALPKTTKKLQ